MSWEDGMVWCALRARVPGFGADVVVGISLSCPFVEGALRRNGLLDPNCGGQKP